MSYIRGQVSDVVPTKIGATGWTIFHGRDEGIPWWETNPDKLIYGLYRNGMIAGPRRAQRFLWLHNGDEGDLIAYKEAE